MLTATLESPLGDVQVRVDDLSAHGARVSGDMPLPIDAPVTFRCKTLSVEGFVAWVEATCAGIGFGVPIEPNEALRKVTPASPPIPRDFRRPGFRETSLTSAERRSAEEWGRPPGARPGG